MKIGQTGASIKAVDREEIPPNPANMITALRQIGYTVEQSIADLIDNSINAEAKHVLVRFIRNEDSIIRLLIADDGYGMNEQKLREAMKFGSEQPNDGKSLGKYGMGLKVASLGYAQSLTVLTRKGPHTGGRRWTVKGISEGWVCETLDTEDVKGSLNQPMGNVDLSKSGTVLIWSDIDRLKVGNAGVSKALQRLTRKLNLHFGLCFHRFIEDGRLEIRIDDRLVGEEDTNICTIVEPINPFGYPRSGHDEFPKHYRATIPGVGPLKVEAHIWPPNEKSIEYRLGGKAAQRQGFYFYRNDRLIQAGGWNEILESETDPHNSLTRIAVNLDPDQDSQYGLNVQKSAIIAPGAFEEAMARATSSDGDTLADYRSTAQKVYRKDERFTDALPLVPDGGIPKSLARDIKELITGGRGRVRKVNFEWGDVKGGDVFWLDRRNKTIVINRAYRNDILAGRSASASDVPLFKLLLFLLTENDIDNSRVTSKQKQRLDLINEILMEAAVLGKG